VATYQQMRNRLDVRRNRRPTRRTLELEDEHYTDSSPQRKQVSRERVSKHFSHNKQTRSRDEDSEEILLKILQRLDGLERKYETLNRDRTGRKRDVICFRCQQKGHYARECVGESSTINQNSLPCDSRDAKAVPLNYQRPALVARGRSQ